MSIVADLGSAFLCPYCLCGIGWVWYSGVSKTEVRHGWLGSDFGDLCHCYNWFGCEIPDGVVR